MVVRDIVYLSASRLFVKIDAAIDLKMIAHSNTILIHVFGQNIYFLTWSMYQQSFTMKDLVNLKLEIRFESPINQQ
jgi:hypothetical protein